MPAAGFAPDRLHRFAVDALCAVGVPMPDAGQTADVLVDADLRGLASHGILRLPLYVDRVRRGMMAAQATITVIEDRPALAHLDANFALGPVAGIAATDMASVKAKAGGVGLVLMRQASHFGTAGYYARRIAEGGLVGVVASNTAAMLAAPGGQRGTVGNNPLAVAFPDGAGGVAFVTDLSFGAVALGKIIVAKSEGRPIPPNWALDTDGQPTTNPAAALASGVLQAMAGSKGFALALAVEALSGLLSGADFGTQVKSIYRDPDQPQNLGQIFLALDPTAFLTPAEYADRIAALRAMVMASTTPGAQARMPGTRGNAGLSAAGLVTLPDSVAQDLSRLADALGLPHLSPTKES